MIKHLGEILNAFFLEYLQRYRQEGERIRLRKLKRIKKFSKLRQIKDVATFCTTWWAKPHKQKLMRRGVQRAQALCARVQGVQLSTLRFGRRWTSATGA